MKLKSEMEIETFGIGEVDAIERRIAVTRERRMMMNASEQQLYATGGNFARNLNKPAYPCDDYGHED